MPIHLRIENEQVLPDGGPISISVNGPRGIDIGRDPYLDWVLPDPTRTISGKHCELRFRDGDYWLHDTSTNGTFVNRSEYALDAPHRLADGDRIEIGKYVIAVSVEPEPQIAGEATGQTGASAGSLWDVSVTAPPADPRDFRPGQTADADGSDPLDWLSDVQAAQTSPPVMPPPAPLAARPAPRRQAASAPKGPAHTPHEPVAPFVSSVEETLPPPQASGQPEAVAPSPAIEAPAAAPPSRRGGARAASMPDGEAFRAAFARGAGLEPEMITLKDDTRLAEMAGRLVAIMTESLMQLNSARAKSKGIMRSANVTLIQARENNPLRFSPTTQDALRILLGPETSSYLDAARAVTLSFEDQKKHQLLVFSAMQEALVELLADLDPARIEQSLPPQGGVGAMVRSKQARLWDHYQTVWTAKAGKSDKGMVDVFMRLFAQAYDRSS